MIVKLTKKEGWEVRLNDLIMKYYDLEFETGQNCCFLFISDWYEAMTGESPLSEWRGKFKTTAKGLALYKKHAGMDSFEKAFQWLTPVESVNFAQRGDMGIWNDNGIEVLGGVASNGRDFLFRCEDRDGLVAQALNQNMRFWRAE